MPSYTKLRGCVQTPKRNLIKHADFFGWYQYLRCSLLQAFSTKQLAKYNCLGVSCRFFGRVNINPDFLSFLPIACKSLNKHLFARISCALVIFASLSVFAQTSDSPAPANLKDSKIAPADLPRIEQLDSDEPTDGEVSSKKPSNKRSLVNTARLVDKRVDSGHLIVANSVDSVATWLDRWLGGDDIDYSSRESQARLRHSSLWEESESYDGSIDFRLKLLLPNTEKKLKLIVRSDTDDRDQQDLVESRAARESREAGIALQIAGFHLGYTQTDFRFGLKSGKRIRTAVRTKYNYPFTDRFQLKGVNEFYWLSGFGVGQRLRTELDYLLKEGQLLRWRSVLDFNEVDEGLPWETSIEWDRVLDDNKIVKLYMQAQGQTRPEHLTESYGPGLVYRQSVGKPWFFIECETRLFWEREEVVEQRKSVASFILRLELVFDEESSEDWH